MEIDPLVSQLKNREHSDSFTRRTDVFFESPVDLSSESSELESIGTVEESLVVDTRSELSPAQLVEHKLTRMLRDASMPVSHMQVRSLLRAR